MRVEVNGKEMEFKGAVLSELLSELNLGDSGYAVALGSCIVSKDRRDKCQLHEGDKITIIVATHGG